MTQEVRTHMKLAIRALVLMLAAPLAIAAIVPAAAQVADSAQQKRAGAFIEKLGADAFSILRDKGLDRDAARGKFRDLLRQNFAVDRTGVRLIRSYRAPSSPIKLTEAQLTAYRRALPDYLVNTYSDRLYDFATADISVVRTAPRGSRGEVDVFTRITDPAGGRPIDAIWSVDMAGARPLVTNITVNGVNVALTQEADFKSYIERNGFDALVDFMNKAQ